MADEHILKNRMARVSKMLRGTIGQKPIMLPGLERTSYTLGSFSRILLNAQVAQVICYDGASLDDDLHLPNNEKSFWVSRTNLGEMTVPKIKTMECNIKDYDVFNSGVDHGLTSVNHFLQSNRHEASLRTCSCQYPLLWGLTCRHMLRVMFHLSGSEVLQRGDSWDICLVS